MADAPLGEQLKPCGPVVDPQAADRAHAALAAAGTDGGTRPFEAAWPALAPVFAASPYLFSLVRHDPERLNVTLEAVPAARLEAVLAAAANAGGMEVAAGAPALRRLKADLHLLTALADLGGVWDLDQVTSALTRFADAAVGAALRLAAREAIAQGKLAPPPRDAAAGPVPGLFVIAMGKHGGFELNYSSDIDVSVFYEPAALPAAPGIESQALAIQLTQAMARLLQERTAEGYVFRVTCV